MKTFECIHCGQIGMVGLRAHQTKFCSIQCQREHSRERKRAMEELLPSLQIALLRQPNGNRIVRFRKQGRNIRVELAGKVRWLGFETHVISIERHFEANCEFLAWITLGDSRYSEWVGKHGYN